MEENKFNSWQILLGLLILALAIFYFVRMPENTDKEDNFGENSFSVGETKKFDGLEMTFVALVQDNRCPIDVVCIEGGAVNTTINLKTESKNETLNYASDGVPLNYEGFNISIANVLPEANSKIVINPNDYIVTFKIEKNNISENNLEDTNIEARQLCYVWNTESGDSAKLSMDIRGENVIGEFYWLPKDKDSKVGVFKGKAGPVDPYKMARTFEGFWEAKAEGVTVTEELQIVFGEGIANVLFGEMVDRGDGVYVYKDKTKLSYEPNLQQTDCGDSAMD